MFEGLAVFADSIAARAERSLGKPFGSIPPADLISGVEIDLMCTEARRLVQQGFGRASIQARVLEDALEPPAFDVDNPDSAYERQRVRAARLAAWLRTLDQSLPSEVVNGPKAPILFVAACPADKVALHLDEEVRAIDAAIRKADLRDQFDIRQQWATRIDDLQDVLLRYRPSIVHFSGHATAAGEIVLVGGDGGSTPVPREAFAQLFAVLGGTTRCVVLNACSTEPLAEAIAEHVDCVVGMSSEIGNLSAARFAAAFYRALAYGESVKTAFDLGVNEIGLHRLAYGHTPHLFARRADAADVRFAAAAPPSSAPEP